jgi:hypothetical protein
VRGYHPLLAACAGDSSGRAATQLLHSWLRGGNAHTGRGADSFVAEIETGLSCGLWANGAYAASISGTVDATSAVRRPANPERRGCPPVRERDATGDGAQPRARLVTRRCTGMTSAPRVLAALWRHDFPLYHALFGRRV